MKIFNNQYPSLFTAKDAEKFLKALRNLVNEFLKNSDEEEINFNRFSEDKFNKFEGTIHNIYLDKFKKEAGLEKVDDNFIESKIQEVANSINENQSFAISKMSDKVRTILNHSSVYDLDEDVLDFNDTLTFDEVQELVKENSDKVSSVATEPILFSYDKNNNIADLVIDKIEKEKLKEYNNFSIEPNFFSSEREFEPGLIKYTDENGKEIKLDSDSIYDDEEDNNDLILEVWKDIINYGEAYYEELIEKIEDKFDGKVQGLLLGDVDCPNQIPSSVSFTLSLSGLSLNEQIKYLNLLNDLLRDKNNFKTYDNKIEFDAISYDGDYVQSTHNLQYDDIKFNPHEI